MTTSFRFGRTTTAAISALTLLVGFAPIGCGGNKDFGERVMVPQDKQYVLTAKMSRGPSLSLPDERPFNVADTQRSSEGAGKAMAEASGQGSASCRADASNGGSAAAEFQLGHVLTYDGDSAVHVTVTFEVTYECVLEHYEPRFGESPLGLKAYVMDSDRRMLAKVMLAEVDPDRLPDRWSGSQSPSFNVTLDPGSAYHLVVAGQTSVTGDEVTGATAGLKVNSAKIHILPADG